MMEVASRIPDRTQVVGVMTYPVKSLAGVFWPEGVCLTENGLEGDRLFTLAGMAPEGSDLAPRLTLREHPKLAQIATKYTDAGILLTAERVGGLLLPYDIEEGEEVQVKSYGGPVTGVHVSPDANKWLGDFLGRDDVQILAVPDSHRRVIAEAERQPQVPEFTGRATDGYPLHVVSLASLRRLNEARKALGMSDDLSIANFRANIIIDGEDLAPFAEDELAGIRLEDDKGIIDIMVIRACERCRTVQAKPGTGEKLGNVLKSLISLHPERSTAAKLVFGVWAAPSLESVGGIVRTGQLVRPLPIA
jgi:uncharacterized protein YcbX